MWCTSWSTISIIHTSHGMQQDSRVQARRTSFYEPAAHLRGRGGILKLPYKGASAHLKLAYVLVDGPALPWGLYNRVAHLPFWTPFMGGSLLIFLPALWCLSTAVAFVKSSPAVPEAQDEGSTTAAEVEAKIIVHRTPRQQDLILAHRIVRQMSR